MRNILVISARDVFAERFCANLTASNYDCKTVDRLESAYSLLDTEDFDILFCDLPIGKHKEEHAVLEKLKERAPKAAIVIITDRIDLRKATKLVREGAYTCLSRPVHSEELLGIVEEIRIENSLIAAKASGANEGATPKKSSPKDTPRYIEGKSKISKNLYKQIDIVKNTSLNVIIYGETGTGKESVARRLGSNNDEFPGEFVAIDCGCLSKDLAASELFGHVKGAFTGALNARAGAFEIAKNGTLFLDEIGNLDYQVQTYLLRAIQEKKIRRIGGEKEIDINVRIIVACNEYLLQLVSKGQFREDLYHRLNEFEVVIPPLRERKEDIPQFVAHFVQKAALEFGKKVRGVSAEAMSLLQKYAWLGNIRELKNTIRKICLLIDEQASEIELADLPKNIREAQEPFFDSVAIEQKDLYSVSKNTTNGFSKSPPALNIKEQALQAELDVIIEVLKSVNYNKSKAAQILQINRKTLYNKLKMIENTQ